MTEVVCVERTWHAVSVRHGTYAYQEQHDDNSDRDGAAYSYAPEHEPPVHFGDGAFKRLKHAWVKRQ